MQRGTTTLTTASTATKIETVDLTKSFVLASTRSTGNGTDIGSGMVRAALNSAFAVTFDRARPTTP